MARDQVRSRKAQTAIASIFFAPPVVATMDLPQRPQVAAKHPGQLLLRKMVQTMYTALHPGKATTGIPPALNKFLQQAMVDHGQLEGRNLRELQTIALAGDAILKGKLEEGLEILLQRWKRVEAVATGILPARAAEHLELLPPARPTTLSLAEREECSELNRRLNS